MSTRRFVKTLGQPYFAFSAENLGDRTQLPAFGLSGVHLEFRVDALPVQLSSPDELHPIFSFDHDLQTQPGIMEVGITPSGRFAASVFTGSTWQSAPVIADATTWNTLDVGYDSGSGQWLVVVNNGLADTSVVDPSPDLLLPRSGYQSRFLLFNGRTGISRGQVSVRSVTVGFVGSGPNTVVSYTPTTRQDGVIAASVSGPALGASCDLVAEWYNPLVSPPWGAVPAGDPVGAYAYGLETDWVRLPARTTAWTRVAA